MIHSVSPINTLRTNDLVAVLSFLPNQSFGRVARSSKAFQEAVQTSLWARSPELREAGWENLLKERFYYPKTFNILKRLLIANPTETLTKAKENPERMIALAHNLKVRDLNEETKAAVVTILNAIANGVYTDSAIKAVELMVKLSEDPTNCFNQYQHVFLKGAEEENFYLFDALRTIIEIPSFDLGAAVSGNLLTIFTKEPVETVELFEALANQDLTKETKAGAVTILNAIANGVYTNSAIKAVELMVKLSEDPTNCFNQYQHVFLKGAEKENSHLCHALCTIIKIPSFDLAAAVSENLLTIFNIYSPKKPIGAVALFEVLAKQCLNEKTKAAAVAILNAIANGVCIDSAIRAVEIIVTLSEDPTNCFNRRYYQSVFRKGAEEGNSHLCHALYKIIKNPSLDLGAAAVAKNLLTILNTYSAKKPTEAITPLEALAKQCLNEKTKAAAVTILNKIAKGVCIYSALKAIETIIKLSEDPTNCFNRRYYQSMFRKAAKEGNFHLCDVLGTIIQIHSFDSDVATVSKNLRAIIRIFSAKRPLYAHATDLLKKLEK